MKRKLLAVWMLLMVASGISFAELADEDCEVRTCIDGPPVIKDPEGRWATGIIIGTVAGSIKKGGVFYTSGEVDFLAGGGLPTALQAAYPPSAYQVSIEDHNQSLWYFLRERPDDKPITLKYHYPFIHTGIKTETKYVIDEADEPELGLSGDDPFEKYDNGITDRKSYKYESYFNRDGRSTGLVIHVSRWGKAPYKRRCTVYLHQGGTRTVTRDQYYTEVVTYTDQASGELRTRREYRTRPVDEIVPHVLMMNTFNDDVCRYAEGAALAQAKVRVVFPVRKQAPCMMLQASSFTVLS